MNKLLVISFVGVALGVSLLTKDIVDYIRAKRMIKRSIKNCFKALEKMEVK